MKVRQLLGLAAVLLVVCLAAGVASAKESRFGGVGLQVVPTTRGDLVVLGVVADSPASRAGLRPGDLIVRVDDFRLAGSDFKMVASKYLWGRIGTTVVLHYLRPGVAGHHAVTLRRAALKPPPPTPPGVHMMTPPGQ
ncbi:MAG TPA: PDZ domain-containing protein [Desulfuromonadales bacterium]|nr:PDZ domain-containing protein [Desulfuromonadales bacterium]